MIKLWPYEVGAKTKELQQRRDVENQRRDVESQSCDVAESAEIEHPNFAILQRSGLVLCRFSAHFGPRIECCKA